MTHLDGGGSSGGYGNAKRPERLFLAGSDRLAASPAEVEWAVRCVLAALYLPGAPRAFSLPPGRAESAASAMRAEAACLGAAPRALRRCGLAEEALALESPGLPAWAERLLEHGRVLSLACPCYPMLWRRRLKSAAPPALWRRGEMPARPLVAVVGSRAAPRKAKRFAREVAAEAVRSGLAVVSGGARGCDAAAARGARSAGFSPSPLVEILPCGLAAAPFLGEGCALSLCPPEEPFSAVAAMRRNALVYAASVGAVVAHARLGEGGTWRGAAEARRRRLSPLLVRLCPEEPALRALAAMGAQPLASAADLGPALERAEHPRDLFSPLFA